MPAPLFHAARDLANDATDERRRLNLCLIPTVGGKKSRFRIDQALLIIGMNRQQRLTRFYVIAKFLAQYHTDCVVNRVTLSLSPCAQRDGCQAHLPGINRCQLAADMKGDM